MDKLTITLIIIFALFYLLFFYLFWLDNHVNRVIDGDTIELNSDDIVRLIGIDTPEIDEGGGLEAKQYLTSILEGKRVRLVEDVSNQDKYGRLLRYVYVGDTFINLDLIQKCYAKPMKVEPDTKYWVLFENQYSLNCLDN